MSAGGVLSALFLHVLEAGLRGAPVLAVGLLVARLLRARGAAVGHAAVFGALAVQVLLVVLPGLAPPIRIAVPSGWESGGPARVLRSVPAVSSPAYRPARALMEATPADGAPVPAPFGGGAGLAVTLLAGLWGTLSFLGAAGFGRAIARRRSWLHRARRAGPREVGEVVQRAEDMGIRRRIEVRISSRETVPVTWGALRPVLLLPRSFFSDWSEERRQAVILHELAHIRRFDTLTRGVARALRTILWFDPLVWWAHRELFSTSETACDDAVLAAGVRPSRYVGDLAAIARPQIRGAAVGVPMVRKGELERRARAILDPRRTPAAAGTAPSVMAALAALPVALSLPALTAVAPLPAQRADVCPYTDGRHLDVVRNAPDGGSVWLVEWEGDGCAVAVRAAGAVIFEPDLSTVHAAGSDARVSIEAVLPGGEARFEAVGGDEGERVTWRVGGRPRPMDEDARAWLEDVLHELDRHTAFAVDARLPAMLSAGGADRVISVAASFPPGHAAGIYLERLVRARALTPEQLEHLLDAAADRVTVDATMASLLESLRSRYDARTLEAAGYDRAAGILRARAAREDAALP